MSDNWWAQKLAGKQAPQAPVVPPRPVQPAVPVAVPQSYPPAPQGYGQQQGYPQPPQGYEPEPVSTKTTYNRHVSICPACQSGNYFKPADPRSNAGYRCYDCGYPVVQTESNTPSATPKPGEVVHPARQLSTANNFHPEIIVDKVPY